MRIMRVAYRGSFEFPKAETPLNPAGWKVAGEIVLEVYESAGGRWKVRDRHGNLIDHWMYQGPSPDYVKQGVERSFEKQVKEWVMIGDGGRELKPEEVELRQQKGRTVAYLLEPADLARRKANKI